MPPGHCLLTENKQRRTIGRVSAHIGSAPLRRIQVPLRRPLRSRSARLEALQPRLLPRTLTAKTHRVRVRQLARRRPSPQLALAALQPRLVHGEWKPRPLLLAASRLSEAAQLQRAVQVRRMHLRALPA